MKRNFILLLIFVLFFPLIINAETCTFDGTNYHTASGKIIAPNSGDFNYYCLEIDHCFAKEGAYYDAESNKVSLEEYYASCGCRIESGIYYDTQGKETTEQIYNKECLKVGKCSKKNNKYYDDNYNEVSETEYKRVCGCRIDENTGKFYDTNGNETTEQIYNKECLKVGVCSIKEDKYYDKDYKEVSEEEYYASCGCRIDDGKYYDTHGNQTDEITYNKECLKVDVCSQKNGKYYDNNYKEITKEEYEKICKPKNPKTGVRTFIYVFLMIIVISSIVLLVIDSKKIFKM